MGIVIILILVVVIFLFASKRRPEAEETQYRIVPAEEAQEVIHTIIKEKRGEVVSIAEEAQKGIIAIVEQFLDNKITAEEAQEKLANIIIPESNKDDYAFNTEMGLLSLSKIAIEYDLTFLKFDNDSEALLSIKQKLKEIKELDLRQKLKNLL